jgi:hypothetical protein
MRSTASSSTSSCHHDVLLHHGTKINGAKDYGTKYLKPLSKINLSSLVFITRYLVTAIRKVINTENWCQKSRFLGLTT